MTEAPRQGGVFSAALAEAPRSKLTLIGGVASDTAEAIADGLDGAAAVAALEQPARRIALALLCRMLDAQRKLGPWVLPSSRELTREAVEESIDAAVYLTAACEAMGVDHG